MTGTAAATTAHEDDRGQTERLRVRWRPGVHRHHERDHNRHHDNDQDLEDREHRVADRLLRILERQETDGEGDCIGHSQNHDGHRGEDSEPTSRRAELTGHGIPPNLIKQARPAESVATASYACLSSLKLGRVRRTPVIHFGKF